MGEVLSYPSIDTTKGYSFYFSDLLFFFFFFLNSNSVVITFLEFPSI
jgi:hypothetical protein